MDTDIYIVIALLLLLNSILFVSGIAHKNTGKLYKH